MDYISDHKARALARLAEQLRDIPELQGLIAAKARQTQALEDAVAGLVAQRGVDVATGPTLRLYARLVGVTNAAAYGDESLRRHVKARILINRSSGTVGELVRLFDYLVGSPRTLAVAEGDAEVVLAVTGGATSAEEAADYAEALTEAKAAGVRTLLEWHSTAAADAFIFNGTVAQGLGDTANAATGGQLGSVAEA